MKIKGKKWYIIGALVITLFVGVLLSLSLNANAIYGDNVEDYIFGNGRVRAMSINESALTQVSLELRQTVVTYDAEPQEYVLKGTHSNIGGFVIEYYVGGEWTTSAPTNYSRTGYKVRITRPADATYAEYTSPEFVGLDIQKKEIALHVKDYTLTYGDETPSYEAVVVDMAGNPGLQGDDNISLIYQQHKPTFECDYTSTSNVGEYVINLTNYSSFTPLNYVVRDAYSGTVTVNPDTIEYTAESFYGYYDGKGHGIDVRVKNVEDAEIYYSFDGGNVYLRELTFVDYTRGQKEVHFKIVRPNYETVIDSRFVTIRPKQITLCIEDSYSKQGEPIRPLYFHLHEDSYLAEGDTLEDLEVTLYKASGDKAGRYTIYGNSLNSNYSIAWINAVYTITATTLSDDHDGSVILDCIHGLDPDYTLSFEETTSEHIDIDLTHVTGEYTEVIMAYDINVLDKESNVVSVEGKSLLNLRVRLTAEQKNIKNLQIIYLDDYGNAYKLNSTPRIVGDYLVFTVDHLSTYAIVGDMTPNYMINVIAIMLIADVIMLLCFILLKRKNRHIFYSFYPFLLTMYTPKETTIAIISLAIVTVVLAIMIFVEMFKDGDVRNKYDYSFTAKIMLCKKGSIINKFYSKLRNRLYQYKGVTSVITWNGESFYYEGIEIAKIMIDRTYLDLFVAIEYGFFRNSKYNVKNAIRTAPGKTTPSKLNIDTEEDYIEACDIVDMVAEKYNLTKSRKYTNVDYSTRQVQLNTLIHRGLVITDKMIEDESSLEPKEVKNIYKAAYVRNKSVRHITLTNDDNSLSMCMCEVTNTFRYFIERLKGCNARCTANYTNLKNILLSYEKMINKIDQAKETFYLGNVNVCVTVNEKHIFIHFEGFAEELQLAFKENEINGTSTIMYDLNYDENVATIMSAITKIANKYNLLKMSDYRQKSFKSLILDN
ncbi:MAG: hypothetical protein IJW28_02680 [Clostridia bacterium]|nr:hypothetical protein [Clostridia bacterium]